MECSRSRNDSRGIEVGSANEMLDVATPNALRLAYALFPATGHRDIVHTVATRRRLLNDSTNAYRSSRVPRTVRVVRGPPGSRGRTDAGRTPKHLGAHANGRRGRS